MKTIKFLTIAFLLVLSFGVTSCSKQEDDATPVVRETVYYVEVTSLSNMLLKLNGVEVTARVGQPYEFRGTPPVVSGVIINPTLTVTPGKIKTYSTIIENGVPLNTTQPTEKTLWPGNTWMTMPSGQIKW